MRPARRGDFSTDARLLGVTFAAAVVGLLSTVGAYLLLKPLSSGIAIGSGGPFGAEGPIIMTGGALGSLLGQQLRISGGERKALLVAGAVAGMTAIFGTPIASVMLGKRRVNVIDDPCADNRISAAGSIRRGTTSLYGNYRQG